MPSLAKDPAAGRFFGTLASGAARYARALALHFHSELIVVHVLPPLYSDFGGMEVTGSMLVDVYRTRTAQAEEDLESFAAANLAGLNVRRLILNGEPCGQARGAGA